MSPHWLPVVKFKSGMLDGVASCTITHDWPSSLGCEPNGHAWHIPLFTLSVGQQTAFPEASDAVREPKGHEPHVLSAST